MKDFWENGRLSLLQLFDYLQCLRVYLLQQAYRSYHTLHGLNRYSGHKRARSLSHHCNFHRPNTFHRCLPMGLPLCSSFFQLDNFLHPVKVLNTIKSSMELIWQIVTEMICFGTNILKITCVWGTPKMFSNSPNYFRQKMDMIWNNGCQFFWKTVWESVNVKLYLRKRTSESLMKSSKIHFFV